MIETKSTDEVIQVTFPYATEIGAAAIINKVITPTVIQGTDATPSAVLLGAAQVVGSEVRQLVQNGNDAVRYKLHCLATLDDGRKLARTYIFDAVAP